VLREGRVLQKKRTLKSWFGFRNRLSQFLGGVLDDFAIAAIATHTSEFVHRRRDAGAAL